MTAAYRVVVAERKEIAGVTVNCECGARLMFPVETALIPSLALRATNHTAKA